MGRTNRKLIISLLLLAVSLVTVTVVLADYLGPDRITTTIVWRRLRCEYEGVYDPSGSGYYGCGLTLYYPPSAGCPSTSSVIGNFSASACGWPWSCAAISCSISGSSSTEGCSDGESGCEGSTQTINQPPATISGSISCAAPGSNGWCQSAASLSLSGSEPLSGYSITALEGTRNGVTFACSGSSCSADLLEGQNDFTYWALSSWGDSSTMGSTSGKVDTQAPVISGTLSGTSGDNSWYLSDVTVSASASDGMSGLQSFDINVDGGGYQPYAETTLGEGTHTIELRAVDNAGHVSQVSQSFSVDKTLPQLALSGGGSFCPRCGDILALSYDVQDALSGISGWTLSASGAVIASNTIAETGVVDWDGGGLGGGTHTLTLSVRDAAGNAAETSIIITLNTPRPEPTQARLVILPTRTPTPRLVVPALAPPEPGLAQSKPSLFTFVSEPPETRGFSSPPENPPASEPPVSAQTTASPVLWGGAAAGLIGAAMVVAMEAQRKRKEEEARAIAEMHRLNAEMRAKEKQEALLIAQRRETAALLAAMAAEPVIDKLDDEEEAWLEKKTTAAAVKEKDDSGEVKSKSGFKLAMPAMQNLVSAGIALAVNMIPSGTSKSDKLDVSKGEAGLEASGAKSANTSSSSKYSGSITNPQRPPGVSAVKWALLSREDRLEIAAEHEARMLRVNPPWLLDSGRPVSIDKEDWKYYDEEDRRKAVADVRKMWDTWLNNGYKGDFITYASGGSGLITMTGVNVRSSPELRDGVNNKVATLTRDTTLMWTGRRTEGLLNGKPATWLEVKYGAKTAWVYSGLVFDSTAVNKERFPNREEVKVDGNLYVGPVGTNLEDEPLGQFIYLSNTGEIPSENSVKIRKKNLCWLFSAAHILGLPVDQVINDINSLGSQYLQNKLINDAPEGIEVINAILDIYSVKHQKFSEALIDPIVTTKWSMENPARLKMELDKGQVLTALVRVNGASGELNQGSVNHWVEVMDVFQDDGVWKIKLYNPIPNRTVTYDYQTYLDSYLNAAGWAEYCQEPPPTFTSTINRLGEMLNGSDQISNDQDFLE